MKQKTKDALTVAVLLLALPFVPVVFQLVAAAPSILFKKGKQ